MKRTFQFTPLREGRQEKRSRMSNTADFNSRPSARGDFGGGGLRHLLIISIHAPPRGATAASWTICRNSKFQFTPLREGRRYTTLCPLRSAPFQFTPLREGRPQARMATSTIAYFNSRPSARGDPLSGRTVQHYYISIHAPPRGATQKICNFCKSFVQPLQISMA